MEPTLATLTTIYESPRLDRLLPKGDRYEHELGTSSRHRPLRTDRPARPGLWLLKRLPALPHDVVRFTGNYPKRPGQAGGGNELLAAALGCIRHSNAWRRLALHSSVSLSGKVKSDTSNSKWHAR